MWLHLQKVGISKESLLYLSNLRPFLWACYMAWVIANLIAWSIAQKMSLPIILNAVGLVSTNKASLAFALLLGQIAVTIVLAAVYRLSARQDTVSRWWLTKTLNLVTYSIMMVMTMMMMAATTKMTVSILAVVIIISMIVIVRIVTIIRRRISTMIMIMIMTVTT